jgi:predicted acyl esterase
MAGLTTPQSLAWRRLRSFLRPRVRVTPIPPGIVADWDVPVTVRDGTRLRVNVFRPVAEGRYPVIMSAHPYGKDRIPARTRSRRGVSFQYRLFPQPDPIVISEWTSWEAPDPAQWVPRGYVVINADLRGGGTAEGRAELLGDQEALDYHDLIEWAGTQTWSSGRVGLDGVSYLAISQYKVAALHPPHLAAICPWEGFSDLYRDFARPGGAREDGFSIIWSKGTARTARVVGDLRQEIVARPERDEWYQARSPALERIMVPALICASFSDHSLHSRGAFAVFQRAGSPWRWLYTHRGGKWSTYYGAEATETRIRFFDHVLKGAENGWPDEPRVRLAIHDAGPRPVEVRGEAAWPPLGLDPCRLWLDAGAVRLVTAPPPAARSIGFDTAGPGLRFTWEIPATLDVIGPMALRLWLEVRGGEDVLLFAGLRKYRAGREVRFEGSFGFAGDMVTKGWQRAAHRGLDESLSTPLQPVHRHDRVEPLQPGEIVPVEIALLPHATRFRAGDRLCLDLRGTWPYPRDPLRGQFPTWYAPSPKGRCVIHTGAETPSSLAFASTLVRTGRNA